MSEREVDPAESAAPEPRPGEAEPAEAAAPEVVEVVEAEVAEVIELNPLSGRVADLEVQLAASEAQKNECLMKLRAVSKAFHEIEGDMAAFRVRAQRDSEQRGERRIQQAIEQFFEPVMNLRRSLTASATAEPAQVVAALPMVVHQFNETMARLGLEEVPGVGSSFDPAVHEALALQPVTDPAEDGKVLMVYSAGWRLSGKVLQAAQVVVGKHEAAPAEA